ncbi:MAG: PQQ-dependent sugar dehydrogenase [Solirubrobacteraceae bacterium]
MWRALCLAMVVGVLGPASASAGVKATPVGQFSAPTYMASPPGDTHRLFVVQQGGQIALIRDGGQPTVFLDISSEVHYDGGEQGLLSMAFAPDYASSHRFYVYYTDRNCDGAGGCDERVSEFTADSGFDTASAGSERMLLTIPHPGQTNHNGGQLQFGPDGDLYISVGDGGGGDDTGHNAQSTHTLLGKVLRISVAATPYAIPAGNPFTGPLCTHGSNPGSNCPEIWAYGLRNPWRFSFDSATGDMIIADVGQSRDEEIDFAHPGQNVGANYGWPCYEGLELNGNAQSPSYPECSPPPAPVVAPVLSYPHPANCGTQQFCGDGIIGGYVVHDPTLPSLNGCYVFGDLSNPSLQVVGLQQPSAVGQIALGPQVSNLSSFGLDASGHLYAADIGGTVYRLDSDGNAATDPTCPTAIPIKHPPVNTALPQISGPPISGARLTCLPGTWTGAGAFAYEWLRDGVARAAGVTYRPTAADVGHTLSCLVSTSNTDGSADATSPPVRIVRIAPPLLFALRISPATFHPSRTGPSVIRPSGRGATVSFRLDEQATVTFAIQRGVSGTRAKGRCRTAAHAAAKACTIWRTVKGSFRVSGKRGLNRVRFSGRLNHRALPPGHYRLALRARDSAHRASQLVRVRFTIKP